jgi:hypothetical protein
MLKNVFLLIIILPVLTFAQKSVLDKGFKNNTGSKEVAVVIVNTFTNEIFQTLTQNISDIFRDDKGYNTNPSFFNTNFVMDGTFEKLFNTDEYKIRKLKLNNHLDFFCLGKYSILSINQNEYNMFTADIKLQINFINANSGALIDSRSYTDRGIGITKQESVQNAIDKILKQLK